MKFLIFLLGAFVAVIALLISRHALIGPSYANPEELVVWFHQYGEKGTTEALQRYAREFEQAHPGEQVKVSVFPGDFGTKMNTSLLAGHAPDVFEYPVTLEDINNHRLAPLNAALSPKNDFDPRALKSVEADGKIYGVPIVLDSAFLYYRRSMLKAAGVAPPQTLRELMNAAVTLTTNQHKGLFIGNDGGANEHFVKHIIWSAGQDLINKQGCRFDPERIAPGLEMLRRLNESGCLLIGSPVDWWDPSAFINGNCAMQWCGLWAMPAIKEALGDDFGILPWPALDARGTPAVFLGGHWLCINANTPHRDLAFEYLQWTWIDNLESQADWNLAYGFHIPPQRSVSEEANVFQAGIPAEALRLVQNYGKSSRDVLWTPAMDAALTNAAAAVIKRGTDAKTELEAAMKSINGNLDGLIRR